MKTMVRLLLVCLCAAASQGAPQVYELGGVLQPEVGNVGPYDRIVSHTIGLLPQIGDAFGRITQDRSTTPQRVEEVIMEFMPLTRLVMGAHEDVEGDQFSRDQWYRFNAAEAVLPPVFTFMTRLRNMDFFDLERRNVDASGTPQ